MKKKLSLNKLQITSMDAQALRAVRGGDTFDTWSTYESGCTVNTNEAGCNENNTDGQCSNEQCPSYPDGCVGETLNPRCPTEGCMPATLVLGCNV
ncbi:hypothetical protein DHW03_15025 [Pedobacter yonginense]|uniref:Uncharacterized protein n=1 Tax=Pedobacter yonginense TaxID=651869 RepID=A0A317EJ31_9SPHI|nr:hypothetical protein DHW03_15025 [Pedobacter yonginense]